MRKRLTLLVVGALVLGGTGLCPAGSADPNLVGWWQLNDGSGQIAADSTGKGVDGILSGGPAWSKDGVEGGCLLFDGADDYVFIDGGFKLGAYTMAVWFRADMPGQRDIISAYAKGVLHGILLEIGTDGRLRFLNRFPLGTGGGNNIYASGSFTDGSWHHVAITKSKTEITLWVDGQQLGSMPDTSVFDPTDSFGVALGCLDNERGLARQLLGAMDEARIYNRALAADEIKTLIPRKLTAYKPDPADGAVGVSLPLFRWTPGETAKFHNLYLGTSPDLKEADLKGNRLPMTTYYFAQGLQPGATYYWRVDEIEQDGTTVHTGNVWTFLAQDVVAYYPTPAHKADDASSATTLAWMAPVGTVQHHLYLGDSLEAVTQGAAGTDQGLLTERTFIPKALENLKTYYWRVDEVIAGGTVRTGPVWSFSTTLTVDDFESYTDEQGQAIFETWIDGYTNATGSIVGYANPPFAEQKAVHGDKQAMPLDYNNVKAPFYSETQREFESAQDWSGAGTLVLYVRGRSSNGPTAVYVGLEDAAKKTATVVHPDPALASGTKWTAWKIPLSDFAGVNPARIKKMSIGVGDKANPKAGGKGMLYFDDIVVAK